MGFKYFPHTQSDIDEMLAICGEKSLNDLFKDIPTQLQLNRDYDIPEGKSEIEIRKHFDALGAANQQMLCFIGAGCYDHYTPSAAMALVQRSEFLTSYTPYQAEVSQGTLQYIFEFQSMMSELTGLEVSNASMYDGATATAEAMIMAVASAKKRSKVLVSSTINPNVIEVLKTYAGVQNIEIVMIDQENGVTSKSDFETKVGNEDIAGVIVASPNYYGIVEDYEGWSDICHSHKSLLIMNCIASSLAVLRSPGELGADIAVGDAQSLGLPMNFGGPFVGYMCTRKSLIRKMPGRIVGVTQDTEGKRAFVLTLQAREQHIRREKATSNICSNQSLMALLATIYTSLMGKQGLKEVNEISYANAHYMAEELCKTGKFELAFPEKPFLNEFVVKVKGDVDKLQEYWLYNGVQFGLKIADDQILLCATEKRTKEEIDVVVQQSINVIK